MKKKDLDFLKQITILYVEDDIDSRKEIAEVFSNYVKEVLEAGDGEEALTIYKKHMDESKPIDIVISDINMPKKSGIEFLEDLRNLSKKIPVIFTTAHTDSPILLDAIKYKVTSYVVKPIDFVKLLDEVLECTKKRFKEKKHKEEKKDLHNHLSNIDEVAIVLKSDGDGNLTYANKAFYDISKYERADIIGQEYNSINHPDVSVLVLREMWDDAKEKGIWNGKLKSKAKDDSIFYVNTTLIPIFDNENETIIEYYHISFSITNYEQEKRDFKKRVIENVQENRKQTNAAKRIIYDLQLELDKYKKVDLAYIQEKKKNIEYLNQLKLYADKLTEMECLPEDNEVKPEAYENEAAKNETKENEVENLVPPSESAIESESLEKENEKDTLSSENDVDKFIP